LTPTLVTGTLAQLPRSDAPATAQTAN
jgi:hypothetical protein